MDDDHISSETIKYSNKPNKNIAPWEKYGKDMKINDVIDGIELSKAPVKEEQIVSNTEKDPNRERSVKKTIFSRFSSIRSRSRSKSSRRMTQDNHENEEALTNHQTCSCFKLSCFRTQSSDDQSSVDQTST